MSRTLVVLAAVSALMSTALAQAPPTSSAAPGESAAPAASSTSQAVPAQSADEWLASKLKGTAVIGSDELKIGDISDVLFDRMGHVKAFVVGVGGILGIGAKQIALDMNAFQQMPATEGKSEYFKLSMTADQLKQMAEFKPLPSAPTTTGLAPAPAAQRPAGNPRAPAPDNK